MKLFIHQAGAIHEEFEEYEYTPLLSSENGCRAGCRTGLLKYTQDTYKQGGIHNDQEGFYVLAGTGKAMVGDEEFSLCPGLCFIVPPGLYHSIKRDNASDFVQLFFFHAAV